jgi:microcystin-dependent protein
MAENPFIGSIAMFAGNFAPTGWALCNGQLLAISQNTALFSILGTTFGGDGTSNFALPDLQGRVPVHAGQGTGLSLYDLGESGGAETVALTEAQLPAHTHTANAGGTQTTNSPSNAIPAQNGAYTTGSPSGTMATDAIGATGSGGAHPNIQPFLAVNFIIALVGIFPPRS